MVESTLVEWSRLQFALTACYHWIFVPLTLGLAVIMALDGAAFQQLIGQIAQLIRLHGQGCLTVVDAEEGVFRRCSLIIILRRHGNA